LAYALNDFKNFITNPKVAYFIWKSPYIAGSDNFINELLKLNHFKNIYDNNPETPGRYPEIELIKKVEGDPEIVFFPQSFPFKKEDGYEIEQYTNKRRPL
jgi:ABC-type Fe3+-hydroxamate transport system substrate-binding protein